MKQLTAALAVALAVVSVVPLRAADVSGTWEVDGDVVGNPVKFVCTLKQEGEELSGTATIIGKEVPVKGHVKDRVVTFQFDVEHEGNTYTDVFTGKLGDDDTMAGTIAVAGVEGTFTAKKQKASKKGRAACQVSFSGSFTLSTQTLPVTGTYAIVIDPNDVNTGSIVVSVTSP